MPAQGVELTLQFFRLQVQPEGKSEEGEDSPPGRAAAPCRIPDRNGPRAWLRKTSNSPWSDGFGLRPECRCPVVRIFCGQSGPCNPCFIRSVILSNERSEESKDPHTRQQTCAVPKETRIYFALYQHSACGSVLGKTEPRLRRWIFVRPANLLGERQVSLLSSPRLVNRSGMREPSTPEFPQPRNPHPSPGRIRRRYHVLRKTKCRSRMTSWHSDSGRRSPGASGSLRNRESCRADK